MSLKVRRYANELYELAKQAKNTELYCETLEKINQKINSDVELYKFIDSSNNSESEKKEKLQEIFSQTLNEDVLNNFFMINRTIGKKHTEIALLHDYLVHQYKVQGILFGQVFSASILSKEQIAKLEESISKLENVPVRLENKVDSSIIGGIKVTVNDKTWDGSFKTKLENLKNDLLSQELKDFQKDSITKTLNDRLSKYDGNKIDVQIVDYVGTVTKAADGVVNISGIGNAMAGELLDINGSKAMVMNLQEDNIGAVLLSDATSVVEGDEVRATGRVVEVPVGDGLLGRVVDALGRPIDGKGLIKADKFLPIEREAPGVIDRQSVNQPLETGIKIIDSMIPIGKGQRELIIGDRQTGKTAIAIDTIINQKGRNVKCIYVAIGQKNSTVAQIVDKLNSYGALSYTTIVVSGASDLAALQYIAPYSGCTIGEYWMEKGEDVLIVYDDLSKHAIAYRTLSLLLMRPPGREAYPGDVFYLHSRLLERSAKLSEKLKGGSLTALPIVETLAGDISAYIPTNVISITDGQIFLQTELFYSGVRPAVDSGLSVSRVGSAAQSKAMKKVSSSLKLDLAQYHEVLDFAQFGSDLDASTKATINHGQHLTELLKQPQYSPVDTVDQILLLLANQKGCIDNIPINMIKEYSNQLLQSLHTKNHQLLKNLREKMIFDKPLEDDLTEAIKEFTDKFRQTVR